MPVRLSMLHSVEHTVVHLLGFNCLRIMVVSTSLDLGCRPAGSRCQAELASELFWYQCCIFILDKQCTALPRCQNSKQDPLEEPSRILTLVM